MRIKSQSNNNTIIFTQYNTSRARKCPQCNINDIIAIMLFFYSQSSSWTDKKINLLFFPYMVKTCRLLLCSRLCLYEDEKTWLYNCYIFYFLAMQCFSHFLYSTAIVDVVVVVFVYYLMHYYYFLAFQR